MKWIYKVWLFLCRVSGRVWRADRLIWLNCADCGGPIGFDDGQPDGCQLEDGRTVCQKCCRIDTEKFFNAVIEFGKREKPDYLDEAARMEWERCGKILFAVAEAKIDKGQGRE